MAEGAAGLDLGKKAGPLPIGAWVVVVAGGLAIGWYFNRKQGSSKDAALLAELGTGKGGSGFQSVLPPSETPKSTEPATNAEWGAKAIKYLIGLGYPATVADEAVRKYLTGQTLNATEKLMINDVLVKLGPPPESLPGPPGGDNAPNAVLGLAARAVPDPDNNVIEVTWFPSPGATSYYVTQDSGGDSETTVTAPRVIWWVASNIKVTFTVVARNQFGDSEPRSVTVDSGPVPVNRRPHDHPDEEEPPPPPPPPSTRTHTVVRGDTLWDISYRYYGNATLWMQIYNANAGAIESAARAHGRSSSRGGPVNQVGWWIYPGTTLTIP